jgi:hypothetical protein
MRTQSPDTHPEAEAVQIALLRQASVAHRITRMRSLTASLMQLSKRAIRRANPGLSEDQLKILFVKYHYGEELAQRFQQYLSQKTLHGNK